MGLECKHYVFIGVNMNDYIEITEETLEKINNIQYSRGILRSVIDYQNNKYNIVGMTLTVNEDYEGLDYTEISINDFNNRSMIVKEEIKSIFNINVEPKFIAVSNWI